MLLEQESQCLRVLEQAVAPKLNSVQGMACRIGFASQVLQLQFDGRGIEFAHKSTDVLQLATTTFATVDAAILFNREGKRVRQVERG